MDYIIALLCFISLQAQISYNFIKNIQISSYLEFSKQNFGSDLKKITKAWWNLKTNLPFESKSPVENPKTDANAK